MNAGFAESMVWQRDDGFDFASFCQKRPGLRAVGLPALIVKKSLRQHQTQAATRFQELYATLDDDLFRSIFVRPVATSKFAQPVLAKVILVILVYLVSKRGIAHHAGKSGIRVVQTRICKGRFQTRPSSFNIGVAVVMEEQVDFTNSRQDFVILDAINVGQGEVGLELFTHRFGLSGGLFLNPVPGLPECLQKKTALPAVGSSTWSAGEMSSAATVNLAS